MLSTYKNQVEAIIKVSAQIKEQKQNRQSQREWRSLGTILGAMQKTFSSLGGWTLADMFALSRLATLHTNEENNQINSNLEGNEVYDMDPLFEILEDCEIAYSAYFGKDTQKIADITCLKYHEILYVRSVSSINHPAYFIAYDETNKKILLVIRGTSSMEDILTDLTGACDDTYGVISHQGMKRAAITMIDKDVPILQYLFAQEKFRGYNLKIIGHSLGGGAAVLLTYLLRNVPQFKSLLNVQRIECVTFGCPPCLTSEVSYECRDYVKTVIAAYDVVGRITLTNVQRLHKEVREMIKEESFNRRNKNKPNQQSSDTTQNSEDDNQPHEPSILEQITIQNYMESQMSKKQEQNNQSQENPEHSFFFNQDEYNTKTQQPSQKQDWQSYISHFFSKPDSNVSQNSEDTKSNEEEQTFQKYLSSIGIKKPQFQVPILGKLQKQKNESKFQVGIMQPPTQDLNQFGQELKQKNDQFNPSEVCNNQYYSHNFSQNSTQNQVQVQSQKDQTYNQRLQQSMNTSQENQNEDFPNSDLNYGTTSAINTNTQLNNYLVYQQQQNSNNGTSNNQTQKPIIKKVGAASVSGGAKSNQFTDQQQDLQVSQTMQPNVYAQFGSNKYNCNQSQISAPTNQFQQVDIQDERRNSGNRNNEQGSPQIGNYNNVSLSSNDSFLHRYNQLKQGYPQVNVQSPIQHPSTLTSNQDPTSFTQKYSGNLSNSSTDNSYTSSNTQYPNQNPSIFNPDFQNSQKLDQRYRQHAQLPKYPGNTANSSLNNPPPNDSTPKHNAYPNLNLSISNDQALGQENSSLNYCANFGQSFQPPQYTTNYHYQSAQQNPEIPQATQHRGLPKASNRVQTNSQQNVHTQQAQFNNQESFNQYGITQPSESNSSNQFPERYPSTGGLRNNPAQNAASNYSMAGQSNNNTNYSEPQNFTQTQVIRPNAPSKPNEIYNKQSQGNLAKVSQHPEEDYNYNAERINNSVMFQKINDMANQLNQNKLSFKVPDSISESNFFGHDNSNNQSFVESEQNQNAYNYGSGFSRKNKKENNQIQVEEKKQSSNLIELCTPGTIYHLQRMKDENDFFREKAIVSSKRMELPLKIMLQKTSVEDHYLNAYIRGLKNVIKYNQNVSQGNRRMVSISNTFHAIDTSKV